MMTTEYTFGITFLIVGCVALYLLPTIVATVRGHRVGTVLTLNVLTGWTIAGWLWSMCLAIW